MKEKYPLFEKYYKLLDWILDKCEKFPKNVRFTISSKISNISLDILDYLIEAIYTKDKLKNLKRINILFEKLRIFIRITHDRKYLSHKQYEYVSKEINVCGKMVGGWIKSCEE